MTKNLLVTGNSSGLGLALSQAYLDADWQVYGLSRRGCNLSNARLHDQCCDLASEEEIGPALERLLQGLEQLDLVYLNAGVFGALTKLAEINAVQIKQVMDVNVWANKIILDYLFSRGVRVSQVIAISSGAAISANVGWGNYAISKAALNKLIELYANEFPGTHFCCLAPGLVDTAMQDYLCDDSLHSLEEYPVLKKFREARGTETMPTADAAAHAIVEIAPRLLELESGSYADIRKL